MAWFNRKSKPVETRSDDGYTGAQLAAQISGAFGANSDILGGRPYPGAAAAARTSAAETCARWWSAALGSAAVEADPYGAVTADVLALAGRELIRDGEVVFDIAVSAAGSVRLIPAMTAWVQGDPDPQSWRYRLTLAGPSNVRTVDRPAAAVVHLRWSELTRAPWRGVGPLELAREGARRAWAAETRLADVASIGVGQAHILSTELADNDDSLKEWLDDYADWLRANNGGPFVTSRKFDATDLSRGRAPEPADIDNAREALSAIAAACGIPPTLLAAEPSAATGQREAFRQFLFGAVSPLADLLAVELRDKLDAPDLALSFEELRAADIAGRARAFGSLVKAGYAPQQAAEVCGLPAAPVTAPAAPDPPPNPAE